MIPFFLLLFCSHSLWVALATMEPRVRCAQSTLTKQSTVHQLAFLAARQHSAVPKAAATAHGATNFALVCCAFSPFLIGFCQLFRLCSLLICAVCVNAALRDMEACLQLLAPVSQLLCCRLLTSLLLCSAQLAAIRSSKNRRASQRARSVHCTRVTV